MSSRVERAQQIMATRTQEEIVEDSSTISASVATTGWACAGLNAVYESTVVSKGLEDMKENPDSFITRWGLSYSGIWLAIIPFVFLQDLIINGKSTVQGVNQAVNIQSSAISRYKSVFLLAGAIVLLSAVVDAIGYSYFIDAFNIPVDSSTINMDATFWEVLTTISIFAVPLVTLATELPAVLKTLAADAYRYMVNTQANETEEEEEDDLKKSHPNRFIYAFVWIIGNLLRLLEAVEFCIETYATLRVKMNSPSDLIHYTLLAVSAIRGLSYACFHGKLNVTAISDFATFTTNISNSFPQHPASPMILKMLALMIAFALIGTPAFFICAATKELGTAFLTSPDTSLPFASPAWFISVLTTGAAVATGVLQIYAMSPFIMMIANLIIKTVTQVASCHYSESSNDTNKKSPYISTFPLFNSANTRTPALIPHSHQKVTPTFP